MRMTSGAALLSARRIAIMAAYFQARLCYKGQRMPELMHINV
jgi:hypothetical protein